MLFCHIIGIVIGPSYCWVIIYDKLKPWDVLLVIVVYSYFVTVKLKQGLILYNTTNIITTLKKHVNVNHSIIAKMYEEDLNSPLKRKMEKQLGQKRSNPCGSAIVKFLATKYPF